MINKLKPKSEFSRNVLTLMMSTTNAQAIPIDISPILIRINAPEDFGEFALYMSLASIVAVMATGRYGLLKKNDYECLSTNPYVVVIRFVIFLKIFKLGHV